MRFFEKTHVYKGDEQFEIDLVTDRLRGWDGAVWNRLSPDGEVIVEQGRRINARAIRKNKQAGMTKLPCLMSIYMSVFWHKISSWMMKSSYALTNCSTMRLWSKSVRTTVLKNLILFTNDIDHGSYIADTLRARIRRWAVKKRWWNL